MVKQNFYINRKKEFLITFPRDFVYLTSKEIVLSKLSGLFDLNKFQYIIGAEQNKENNLHYHIYLNCKKHSGFSTRDEGCFNITLPERIVSFYDIGGKCINQKPYKDFNYNEENVKIFVDEDKENTNSYKILLEAHPNIVFKGNKKYDYSKSTKSMIEYVTKEDKEPLSNFDWKTLLKYLSSKNNKRKIDEVIEEEKEFYEYIRENLTLGKTENQILDEIKENENYFYIYCKNYSNTKQLISNFFKKQKPNKPIPFIGKYWITNDLYDYLIYLDNYIKLFHEEIIFKLNEENKFDDLWEDFVKNHPERPRSCYITGPGNCGKTSLLSCFKSFSYWCNGWNYSNYELNQAFNLFDDYDGQCGGNLGDLNDFNYLKPWFACQQIISINGKYKEPKNIKNHKPMIFISNYLSNERFNEKNIKYLKQIGCSFIKIEKHMKEQPSRFTIGGFCKYKEFDFKSTWTYKNLYEHSNSFGDEPEASLTNSNENVHLIEEDDYFVIEDIPRPQQNVSSKATTSNWTPNNFSQTTSGLDGSTNHIFINKYYDRVIDDINHQIKTEDKLLQLNESIVHDCKERIEILKRRYENSFNKQFTKFLELSIKDLENIRFNILNEIRELNDKIIECNRKIDLSCDKIDELVQQLINIYTIKSKTYK